MKYIALLLLLSACAPIDLPEFKRTSQKGVRTIESVWRSELNGRVWDFSASGLDFVTTRSLPLDTEDPLIRTKTRFVGNYFSGEVFIERQDTLEMIHGTYFVSGDRLELCLIRLGVTICDTLK
jgi:hypothetical protein